MKHRLLLLLAAFMVLVGGCGPGAAANPPRPEASPPGETTLTVFTAASLTEAFTEIGKQFEAENPGCKVVFNFAGSQQLAQQLGQGAPADIFASANVKQMNVAIEAKRVDDGTQQIFAHNRLVVIFPADNPASLKELQDLAKPDLLLVLAAEDVPVGQYSQVFLDKASEDPAFGSGFKEEVLNNVVSYEETVKAVLSKVVLGEADAGIVYLSDISDTEGVGSIDIPDELNTIADYPIAPVVDAENPEQAQKFIEFVLGQKGQEILVKNGLVSVNP